MLGSAEIETCEIFSFITTPPNQAFIFERLPQKSYLFPVSLVVGDEVRVTVPTLPQDTLVDTRLLYLVQQLIVDPERNDKEVKK